MSTCGMWSSTPSPGSGLQVVTARGETKWCTGCFCAGYTNLKPENLRHLRNCDFSMWTSVSAYHVLSLCLSLSVSLSLSLSVCLSLSLCFSVSLSLTCSQQCLAFCHSGSTMEFSISLEKAWQSDSCKVPTVGTSPPAGFLIIW